MRKNRAYACVTLLLALTLVPLFGEETMELRIVPSPNLIKNAGFIHVDGDGLPMEWTFDNCSGSPHFRSQVIQHPDGSYLAVDSEWIKFGYWLQTVPVKEGVSYYASCEVQSDGPTPAVWVKCNALKESSRKSPGKLSYVIFRALRYGDELKETLRDFVDEELIINLSPVHWNRLDSEIIIPIDRGIENCAVRVGIYGGDAGQVRFRNPVFREAKAELNAEVLGTGWTELRIPGATPEKVSLDPAQEKQKVSFVLPKAPHTYRAELLGASGRQIVKEISNE